MHKYLLRVDPGSEDHSESLLYSYTPLTGASLEDKNMESDEQFRRRLIYIGVSPQKLAQLGLDRAAEEHGLKRRKIDREETQPIQQKFKMDDRPWHLK